MNALNVYTYTYTIHVNAKTNSILLKSHKRALSIYRISIISFFPKTSKRIIVFKVNIMP